VEQEPLPPSGADRDRRLAARTAGPGSGPHRLARRAGAVPLREAPARRRSQDPDPHRSVPVAVLPRAHVGGGLGGHADLLAAGRFPLLVHGFHLPSSYSGSAKANRAAPCGAPSIPGTNPSTQPPHPLGTAMNCRPPTL